MFKQEFTSILWLLAAIQCPKYSIGEQTANLCYLRNNVKNSLLCVPPTSVICCNEQLSVISINVYGRSRAKCGAPSNCKSGEGCCMSDALKNHKANISLLREIFMTANCFNDVILDQLPRNRLLSSVKVSYSCADSKTNVAAAVAAPVAIILLIVAVVAAIFFIRRRRAANKGTEQSRVEPIPFNEPLQKSALDYRHDSDLPRADDDGVSSEYAEIGGNRNSNLFGGANEYNTISPRHLSVTKDPVHGHTPTWQRETNENYDHIGMQSLAKGKGADTYTHIDHGALKKQHVSNGDVVTETSTYAHADHCGQTGHGANTEYVGGNTYAHVDHSALHEHDPNYHGIDSSTYDSTSTQGVHKGGTRYASEESHYDHAGQDAPRENFGQYGEGGDYSHGGFPKRRSREFDVNATDCKQNQSFVQDQNNQKPDEHSYFVLEKDFK